MKMTITFETALEITKSFKSPLMTTPIGQLRKRNDLWGDYEWIEFMGQGLYDVHNLRYSF
jgi:hypothetical protein